MRFLMLCGLLCLSSLLWALQVGEQSSAVNAAVMAGGGGQASERPHHEGGLDQGQLCVIPKDEAVIIIGLPKIQAHPDSREQPIAVSGVLSDHSPCVSMAISLGHGGPLQTKSASLEMLCTVDPRTDVKLGLGVTILAPLTRWPHGVFDSAALDSPSSSVLDFRRTPVGLYAIASRPLLPHVALRAVCGLASACIIPLGSNDDDCEDQGGPQYGTPQFLVGAGLTIGHLTATYDNLRGTSIGWLFPLR